MASQEPFMMQGARQVLALAGAALHLEQQIKAIEQAVRDAPNLTFDLARSLVETVCKTILTDRGTAPPSKYNDLLKDTFAAVQLAPPEAEAAVIEGFQKIIGGLDSAIGGISALRQNMGLASHGKDAYNLPMEDIQAEFIARAADAIVSFLYRCHRQYSGLEARHLVYENYTLLNEYIDETNDPVRIFQYELLPSKVLFHTDREAYREQVMEGLSNDEGEAAEGTDGETA